jgi:hypothetical protein
MPAVNLNPFDPSRIGRWEACRYPERPPDKLTEFVLSCPACILKLEHTINHPPPSGAFSGYWDDRENIRQRLREKGLVH